MSESRPAIPLFAVFLLALTGCQPSPPAPVSTKASGADVRAQQAVRWLESLPPQGRQIALDKAPGLKESLAAASDPDLKARIRALGVTL